MPSSDIPNSDNEMSKTDLFAMIEAAFPLHPLPEMSIHQAQLLDQSMSREISAREWREAGERDAGRNWKDLSDDELICCDAALSHFDEQSFIYYLPVYLAFALRHFGAEWNEPAWTLVGSVVFSVTHRTPYTLGRDKSLSPEQRDVVVGFLQGFAAPRADNIAADAQKALSRYWLTAEAAEPLIVVPDMVGTRRRQ